MRALGLGLLALAACGVDDPGAPQAGGQMAPKGPVAAGVLRFEVRSRLGALEWEAQGEKVELIIEDQAPIAVGQMDMFDLYGRYGYNIPERFRLRATGSDGEVVERGLNLEGRSAITPIELQVRWEAQHEGDGKEVTLVWEAMGPTILESWPAAGGPVAPVDGFSGAPSGELKVRPQVSTVYRLRADHQVITRVAGVLKPVTGNPSRGLSSYGELSQGHATHNFEFEVPAGGFYVVKGRFSGGEPSTIGDGEVQPGGKYVGVGFCEDGCRSEYGFEAWNQPAGIRRFRAQGDVYAMYFNVNGYIGHDPRPVAGSKGD